MTDTPSRPPDGQEPEQRLPAVVPPTEVAPVERFTSAPSVRKLEFSPERAAQVVRQSANARWVGFLGIIIIVLFISIYWFYELGAPAGLTVARQSKELDAQQVTRVERGYLVYEANCARCHGPDGEGGEGPILNRQDKLFAHLNENYIHNVLTVGGRYVCGNPQSRMPVWADTGNPPGPLNYRQIEELIAFLLATNDQEFTVRDEHLFEPVIDPQTGEVEKFTGWRDPNYQPAPGSTPYPACWVDSLTTASGLLVGRVRGAERLTGGLRLDRPQRHRGRHLDEQLELVRRPRGKRAGRPGLCHPLLQQRGRRDAQRRGEGRRGPEHGPWRHHHRRRRGGVQRAGAGGW
jgi:mono/diheme cytochrome c family protein